MPKSLSVRLDLRGAADFKLEVQARRKKVVTGADAVFSVTADALTGYLDYVDLSVGGLPSGASAVIGTDPVAGDGTTTVTVETVGVAVGKHEFTIDGSPYPTSPEEGVIWAASPALADINTAIALASDGDTVRVPAGSATWASIPTITKGIIFAGAGIGVTVITSTQTSMVAYVPDATNIAADSPFRVSGFTFDAGGTGGSNGMVYVQNTSNVTAITKVRIDHNRLYNSTGTGIWVQGQVYGLADNNTLDTVKIAYRNLGLNRDSWDHFPATAFGGGSNFFFEDNTIIGDTWFEGGHGGRYVARYNSASGQTTEIGFFDVHGNQSADGALYAQMIAEIYENVATGVTRWLIVGDLRGGKSLFYNNSWSGTSAVDGSDIKVREEFNDNLSPTDASDIQHVTQTYIWGNTKNGAAINPYISSTVDYGGAIGLVPQWDVDCWRNTTPFTGASGVGVGLLSARPSSGLTVGVGYWATDTSKLYRAAGATTWETYYTPHTYPHPLRSDPILGD
jgi:hypothetical protein